MGGAEAAAQDRNFVRPPVDHDLSQHHDATFCAMEINQALANQQVQKVGHLTAIIAAHFPNAAAVYEALSMALPYVEKVAATSPTQRTGMLRKVQAEQDLEVIRAALTKAGAA